MHWRYGCIWVGMLHLKVGLWLKINDTKMHCFQLICVDKDKRKYFWNKVDEKLFWARFDPIWAKFPIFPKTLRGENLQKGKLRQLHICTHRLYDNSLYTMPFWDDLRKKLGFYGRNIRACLLVNGADHVDHKDIVYAHYYNKHFVQIWSCYL